VKKIGREEAPREGEKNLLYKFLHMAWGFIAIAK